MSSLFDTGIRPIVDDFLIKEAEKERDYGDYWSASSAGYCMRKLIFQRLKVPPTKPIDARKQRVFTAGHIFHEWMQKLTREAGLSVAQEVELQDEMIKVRGHFDDLVVIGFDENGETPVRMGAEQRARHLILYDYKTVNSRSFTYSKGREMSYYHHMQLGTYMYMLRKRPTNVIRFSDYPNIKLEELSEARILKMDKDALRMEEQQLLWSADLEKEILDYWNTLNDFWERKVMPECTCADHESGFMATEKWNDYFYDGEPCSLKYYQEWKNGGKN